jgi:hypothetical protein
LIELSIWAHWSLRPRKLPAENQPQPRGMDLSMEDIESCSYVARMGDLQITIAPWPSFDKSRVFPAGTATLFKVIVEQDDFDAIAEAAPVEPVNVQLPYPLEDGVEIAMTAEDPNSAIRATSALRAPMRLNNESRYSEKRTNKKEEQVSDSERMN